MSSVVLFKAVNVGLHQRFQPSVLARDLADLDAVNIGAAGTMVIRKSISAPALRKEILGRLSFVPELMIFPGREILPLTRGKPFGNTPASPDAKQFLTVMEKAAPSPSPLPLSQPPGEKWGVKIVAVQGKFVLSWWRHLGKNVLYPNSVVEKQFRVSATTRNWNTVEAICAILEETR